MVWMEMGMELPVNTFRERGLVETIVERHDECVTSVTIDGLPKLRLLRFVERAMVLARRVFLSSQLDIRENGSRYANTSSYYP